MSFSWWHCCTDLLTTIFECPLTKHNTQGQKDLESCAERRHMSQHRTRTAPYKQIKKSCSVSHSVESVKKDKLCGGTSRTKHRIRYILSVEGVVYCIWGFGVREYETGDSFSNVFSKLRQIPVSLVNNRGENLFWKRQQGLKSWFMTNHEYAVTLLF